MKNVDQRSWLQREPGHSAFLPFHCHCKHSLLTDPFKQFCVFRHYLARHDAATCCLPHWETIIACWTIKAACCDECWLPKGNDIPPDFTSELLTVPPSRPIWKILRINWSSVLLLNLSWWNKFLKILKKGKLFKVLKKEKTVYCFVQSNQLTKFTLLTGGGTAC